jgi:sodium/potassium-transporting ATPase subunit alpha
MINWKLLIHAYFFLGLLESICASAMAFWFMQRKGVPFSSIVFKFGKWPAELTPDLLDKAQSVYFFTLVIMQWGSVFYVSGACSAVLNV